MIGIAVSPRVGERKTLSFQPLENGAHLSASEFLRRYDSMPEIKKAELIQGVVYMGSPVRIDQHGEPESLVQAWLAFYSVHTHGVKHAINSTIRLGPDDVPQPDGLLRILPECGGQARVNSKGYLEGAPELVLEVAASTASLDVREKRTSYRRAGVREYIVWRTEDEEVDWWILEVDEYIPLQPDSEGVLRSKLFPGLWLDVSALLAGNGEKVLAKLQEGLKTPVHVAFSADLRQRLG